MSDQGVAVVRRFYEGLAAGDPAAALGVLAADIEWHEARGMPYGAEEPYRGPAEVAERVLGPFTTDVADLTLGELDLRDLGETVLVLGRYHGHVRHSSTEVDLPFAHIWRLDSLTPVEFRQHTDTAAYNSLLAQSAAR